ncbi:MAG: carboxylating nicotinate-nucleotide diphosphorylase [Bacteroidales bacterium]|nr:carboxylating nicotinate-nucleotide diphosphorylase [Bacteroidales bacterium]
MKTKDELIDALLELAFLEDIGDGDHTTLSTIPAEAMGASQLIIKEEGILAGVDVALKVLHKVDPSIEVEVFIKDGTPVKPGDVAFIARGPVRALLIAERTMLNIMQRMSGVATMTARYQKELEGLHTKVLDTRKTTPGMRMLEKEAVALGGGKNHRIGLFDMILIKDNHEDFAGGLEKAIDRAQAYCKEKGKDLKIEVECRSLDDIRRALEHGGVDRIMFDNFTPELTKEAVKLVDGRVETESSGGITIENLRQYGETGVDFISVGALTHSVKGLDMSFKAIK